MKVFILLSAIAVALAGECGVYEHYDSCGSSCPPTCDNYQEPPIDCILMCNPGCHCDEGYVKTNDGRCVKPDACPIKNNKPASRNSGICNLAPETGPCRAYFERFHYDTATGDCKEFVYGGCQGNDNNFKTIEECRKFCV